MTKTHVNFFSLFLFVSIFSSPNNGITAAVDLKFGERVYLESCTACHGVKGDGKGPQAYRLATKPRDFTSGLYKFHSTPSGSLPLDIDIVRTIQQGVRGTSMLPQLHLSEREIVSVAGYLKSFSYRFQTRSLARH